MKRVLVAITALIAALAIGLATVSATAGAAGGNQAAQVAKKKKKKKKKKIPVSITLTIQSTPADTYSPGSATYSGQVSARKSLCFANRPVTISRNGVPVLAATTGATGAYSASQNTAAGSGQYTASVPRQKFVKKGKKNKKTGKRKKKTIICLAAATAPVTIP
jgi:hypothetical protein